MNINLTLSYTQARRAATSLAARVADMDASRPMGWNTEQTDCKLTKSDQRYRAELLDAYDAIMRQISGCNTSQL